MGIASTSIALVMVFYVLIFLLSIASQVLFACAVYQDAKSLNNKDASMWAVLVGIIGLIPGIIYLCIRKNGGRNASSVQQICINCRAPIAFGTGFCPYCGAQQPPANPYLMAGCRSPEECAVCHARAKKLLIAGIICFAASIIVIVLMFAAIVGLAGSSYYDYYGMY